MALEERRDVDRRLSQVEGAIGRFGSDLHDIKSQQTVQGERLTDLRAQVEVLDHKIDDINALKEAFGGAVQLLRFVGWAGIISLVAWWLRLLLVKP